MPSHNQSPTANLDHHRPRVLVKVGEAARRLSISERQVYRLINHGHLDVVHIGSALRIPDDEIDRYIDSLINDPFN